MKDERPTHLDLFSGIGGFALAAQWAGFRTIGFCEIDKYCRGILLKNFAGINVCATPIYRDIADLSATNLRPDLITAGFPCQPFSRAGKQRGENDDRYLWTTMLDVVSSARPTWFVGENVAGILDLEFDEMLSGLEGRSYFVQTFCIPACAVGAPHERERVWIVANSSSDGLEGVQRSTNSQVQENRSLEALDAWNGSGNPFEEWEKLMAESHIRRMDDGISSELDVRPRLRAYGNAIVPQVAYEILREIRKLI